MNKNEKKTIRGMYLNEVVRSETDEYLDFVFEKLEELEINLKVDINNLYIIVFGLNK